MLSTCSASPPRITQPQRHWLKTSDQPVKKETLLVMIVIKKNFTTYAQKKKTLLFLSEPSPNSLWTPIKLQYHLSYLTAVTLAHPCNMNTQRIDYSPSFKRVFMGR